MYRRQNEIAAHSYPISEPQQVVYVPVPQQVPVYVEPRNPDPPKRRGPSNTSIVLMMAFFFALGACFGSLLEKRIAEDRTRNTAPYQGTRP